MDERDWLADRFEEHQTHLRAVAYRMLGSRSEADDAVQEARTLLADSVGLALLVVLETLAPAERVAFVLSGRARVARPALDDGAAGAVWAVCGQPRVVFDFKIARGKIVEIDLIADPAQLDRVDLTLLGGD